MGWLPLKLPQHCKLVVSATFEETKQDTLDNLKCLRAMIEDENQFLKVTELGKSLAWHVTKVSALCCMRTMRGARYNIYMRC